MISGIMIDGFSSLKEAHAERLNDKKNNCYICSMTKPDVLCYLYRCKNKELPSKNIPTNTSYGTISSIDMLYR